MTELNATDMVWREWTARRLLAGDTSRSARELLRDPWPHTAAELWTGDEQYSTPMNAGWLYYDQRALLFIGDQPIYARTDRPRTNDDRVVHLPFVQLGQGEVAPALNRKERVLKFSNGLAFLMPKKYAETIARLASR